MLGKVQALRSSSPGVLRPKRSSTNLSFAGLFFFVFVFVFIFLGPHSRHMKFPRLGVEWELQLAYTIATETWDPRHVCNHSPQEHQVLNPPSEARDRTRILMDTGRAFNLLNHDGHSCWTNLKIVALLEGTGWTVRPECSLLSWEETGFPSSLGGCA